MKHFFFIVLGLLFADTLKAQVGLGTITPDTNAVIDIASTSKGILIPRMSTASRNLIVAPATGLMIFNTTTVAFNYWNGTSWISMAAGNIKELADSDNDTKVEVENMVDEDKIRLSIAGTERIRLESKGLQTFFPGTHQLSSHL